MKLVLRSLAALALAAPAFSVQDPAGPILPPPTKLAPPGSQQMVFVGSDNCSTPTFIGGPGPHNFDNNAATTSGCGFCQPCGLIQRDVWFAWSVSATGTWTVSLCGLTSGMDPVVAVYDGVGCPTGPAIACNDDFCAQISEASFPGTIGTNKTIQVGSFNTSAGGSGSFTVTLAPPGPSNDGCASPTVIAGAGPHAFDNTNATTGVQGQSEGPCLAAATTAIGRDLWYTWTAGSTGTAQLSTCGQTAVDTKVAVYSGSGCPVVGAIGCNDDVCGLQSQVCFPVTAGQLYTIQLGSFPGAPGGPGTFTMTVGPNPPICQYDDGGTENLFGWFAGGELVWMQRFGGVGSMNLSQIRVTWGSAAFPGAGPGNGTSSKVAIWDDPNDDGNPSDAVLVQLVNTTVQLVDTDTFVTVPITPVVMNGTFFLGAGLSHAAGQFVAPMDQSCPIAGVAWYFGNNTATPADYANVGNNVFPPASLANSGFPGYFMVRGGSCTSFPGVSFCHPGIAGVMACPCGNPPSAVGRGCNNSAGTGGAILTDVGTASLTGDTVVFTTSGERPTSLSIVLQGTAPIAAGVPYGDGVRCTGGSLKRLYSKNAVGGSITAPTGLELAVHLRSAALGDTIAPGTNRYYMVYYRDPLLFACPSPGVATFNTTQGRWVRWIP